MVVPSTREWTPIDLPVLQNAQSSGIHQLSPSNWPHWTDSSTKFNRILLVSGDARRDLGLTSLSTGIRAALLTERIDLKDAPRIYNYNVYLIGETADGRFFQSPPLTSSDPVHRSSSPSSWFDGSGSSL